MAATMGSPRRFDFHIDGEWRGGSAAGRFERENPATGQPVSSYLRGGAADIDVAVAAAGRALAAPAWRGLPAAERSEMLLAAAAEIRRTERDLAAIEAAETGKPPGQALDEIRAGAELWRFAAAALRTVSSDLHLDLPGRHMAMTLIEPVGVVALILPWNFPFIVSAERLPFILAAGCTVVAKPSEFAGGSALLLGDVLKRAGLPAGVYNVVTGTGEETGAPLVDHPGVAMISFTGSADNGRRVMAAAARGLKRISLELGGKNPIVVFADADLDRAADAVLLGFTHNAGQCCISTSRLLVERTAADALLAKLAARLRSRPLAQPLATRSQYDKVQSYLDLGKAQARPSCEGVDSGDGDGYWAAPVIFDDIDPASPLLSDEIFGPLLTVQRFDTEDEAAGMANDTAYGLAACIWTTDLERGLRMGRRIRAGRIWINSPQENFPEMPVGGFGASGIGREAGAQGIRAYSEIKSVIIGTQRGGA